MEKEQPLMQKPLKLVVLIFALLQPVTAYLTSLGDTGMLMDQARIPLISPAGYAFSIWGVICLGSVLFGCYQFFSKRNGSLYGKIAPYALVVFAGFTVWLYAASQDRILLTVVIFFVMGYALYRLFPQLVSANLDSRLSLTERIVTYGTFGLYAGWSTVAIIANVAAAIKFAGVSDMGSIGLLWQGGVLVVATAVSALGIWKTKGSIPYAAAILWAFVAIVVKLLAYQASAAPLLYLDVLAVVVLSVTLIVTRLKAAAS